MPYNTADNLVNLQGYQPKLHLEVLVGHQVLRQGHFVISLGVVQEHISIFRYFKKVHLSQGHEKERFLVWLRGGWGPAHHVLDAVGLDQEVDALVVFNLFQELF